MGDKMMLVDDSASSSLPERGAMTEPIPSTINSVQFDMADMSELSELSDQEEDGHPEQDVPGSITGDQESRSEAKTPEPGMINGPFSSPIQTSFENAGVATMRNRPAMIGIGIARPDRASGLKTYGGRGKNKILSSPLRSVSSSKKSAGNARLGPTQKTFTPKASSSALLLDGPSDSNIKVPDLDSDSDLTQLSPPSSSSPARRQLPIRFQQRQKPLSAKRKRLGDVDRGTGRDERGDSNESSSVPSPQKRRLTASSVDVKQTLSSPRKRRSTSKNESATKTNIQQRRRSYSQSSPSIGQDVWSLDAIGSFVWIRVDGYNCPYEDSSKETYWWPGKVVKVDTEENLLQARLYCPPSPTSDDSYSLTIKNPSSDIVLSQLGQFNQQRFNPNNFRSSGTLDQSSQSSYPASSFDNIKALWERAHAEMLNEEASMDDSFPSLKAVLSQVSKQSESEDGSPRRADSVKISAINSKSNAPFDRLPLADQDHGDETPPPPDTSIQIPGELILAKEKKNARKYWPAKVLGYVSPSRSNEPPKYSVKFLDNTMLEITRDLFYIYEQAEFGTCELGVFESVEPLHSQEGDVDPEPNMFSSSADQLEIPEPNLPAPSLEEFINQSMLKQVSYLIPILRRVLQGAYKPAEDRNRAFLAGGLRRVALSKSVPEKGSLTHQEYHELAEIVQRWVVGVSVSNEAAQDDNRPTLDIQECSQQSQSPLSPLTSSVQGSDDGPRQDHDTEFGRANARVTSNPNNGVSPAINAIFPENGMGEDIHESVGSPPTFCLPPSSQLTSAASVKSSSDSVKTKGSDNNNHTDFIATEKNSLSSRHDSWIMRNTLSFDGLPKHEKILYCTDVLLREAVIQLLLWRTGERTTPNVLDDAEEERLHTLGKELASDYDFVHSVQALREAKERKLKAWAQQANYNLGTPRKAARALDTGTRSRPKKFAVRR